jgi:hypothetical protein
MQFGPIYCETPAVLHGFPAEPVNTYSNLIIILLGLVALLLVYRRKPNDSGLWLLASLLALTGVGSLLWHGLRAPWALALDTLPGVLTLFVFVFLWARAALSKRIALIITGGLFLLQLLTMPLFFALGLARGAFFVPLGIELTLLGSYMVWRTRQISPAAFPLSVWVLPLAITALTARTVDALGIICPYIPFGTHFLWHGFLSSAAFVGILMLLPWGSE